MEKTDTTPEPEQLITGKAEPVVADPAPAKKVAPVEKAPKQKTTEPNDKVVAKASKGSLAKTGRQAAQSQLYSAGLHHRLNKSIPGSV